MFFQRAGQKEQAQRGCAEAFWFVQPGKQTGNWSDYY